MMPIRIQRRRAAGWRMPPNTICVTRPGPWGNPFVDMPLLVLHPQWGAVKLRGKSLFAADAFGMWLNGDLDIPALHERRMWILRNVHRLREYEHVACWCRDAMPCHADVLIELSAP